MEISQEELAKMSPEELKEYQKKNCIFCHIVAGDVQSKKMYEDEHLIGILDINPANPGHLLLIPKEHYMVLPQMPDPEISHLFMAAKGLSQAVLQAFKAGGTNLFIANGALAGQKSPHFMMHIIPRMDTDGLTCFNMPRKKPQQLEKVRAVMSPKLYALLGKQPPEGLPKAEEMPKREAPPRPAPPSAEPKPREPAAAETKAPKKTVTAKKTTAKKSAKAKEEVNLDDITRVLFS
ncbi:MAG: HIT domain-containing protein [Nanoarchaeota archaeon]